MSAALSLAALPATEGANRTPPTEALPIPGDPGDGGALITPDPARAGGAARRGRSGAHEAPRPLQRHRKCNDRGGSVCQN